MTFSQETIESILSTPEPTWGPSPDASGFQHCNRKQVSTSKLEVSIHFGWGRHQKARLFREWGSMVPLNFPYSAVPAYSLITASEAVSVL